MTGMGKRFSEEEVDALVARLRGEKAAPVAKPKRPKPARSEDDEQREVVAWARAQSDQVPALKRLFAVPNGGHRSKATAGRLKASGVVPGIPDLLLDVPTADYHGLRIEMKSATGYPSREQKEWIAYYASAGFRASVQRGARLAILEICEYLGLDAARFARGYVE